MKALSFPVKIAAVAVLVSALSGCGTTGPFGPPSGALGATQPPEATVPAMLPMESPMIDEQYIEPAVDYVTSVSPDGLYRAENYGKNTNITAGGLYPAEGIRILRSDTEETVWDMQPGYYGCSFLWSSDSRYLAVNYTARAEGYAMVVDLSDFSQMEIPVPEEIAGNYRSFRPDPYFTVTEWAEGRALVSFSYTGADELVYSGTFVFDPAGKTIGDLFSDEGCPAG